MESKPPAAAPFRSRGAPSPRARRCRHRCAPLVHILRSWDTSFATMPLYPHEISSGAHLCPVFRGYLAYRRSIFLVYLPLLAATVLLSVLFLTLEYGVPMDDFLRRYFGDAWPTLGVAADLLHGPYYVALARDAALCLADTLACLFLLASLVAWARFRTSMRRLRGAFLLTFVAPFVTTALFSTNFAIDWTAVVRKVCVVQLESQLDSIVSTVQNETDAVSRKIERISEEICGRLVDSDDLGPDDTQAQIVRLLHANGLLSNSTDDARCPPSRRRLASDDRAISCALRTQISSTEMIATILQTSMSSMYTAGTMVVTQASATLIALGPTVLSFALGVGRGTMLSKVLLPSSRLPAFFAGFAVFVGLPLVAAFAAFLIQLTQNGWLSCALASLLMAIFTWVPLGFGGGRSGRGWLSDTISAYLDARMLRYPIWHEEAARLYNGRKYMYYVFVCLFAGFTAGYLFSGDPLGQTVLSSFLSYFEAIGTNLGSALLASRSVCKAFANMYVAQITYCDGILQVLGHSHLKEQTDPPDVVSDREAEFRNAAALLSTGREGEAPKVTHERVKRWRARHACKSEYDGGKLVESLSAI
ncbi:hypothetical protein AB1Y20_007954 [Prymnesium parvum]|uniref:Uncharacterized protein n=1 Tax=Prymnesium parvum TaxID=97485 RepID=A0AB34IV81_PRYPA